MADMPLPTSSKVDQEVDIVEQTLGQLTTTLDDALASSGVDELRTDISPSEPLDVSAAEVDVDINSQTLSQVSANVAQVGGAAVSELINEPSAGDRRYKVDLAANNAGTIPVEQQTPVVIENAAGTDKDVLGTGDQPLDVSGSTVPTDPDTDDFAFLDGTGNLASGGTLDVTVAAQGADELHVIARSSDTYSVDLEWKDGNGNILFDETSVLGGALTGGNTNTTNVEMKTPEVTAEINEEGGSGNAQDATLSTHAKGG